MAEQLNQPTSHQEDTDSGAHCKGSLCLLIASMHCVYLRGRRMGGGGGWEGEEDGRGRRMGGEEDGRGGG